MAEISYFMFKFERKKLTKWYWQEKRHLPVFLEREIKTGHWVNQKQHHGEKWLISGLTPGSWVPRPPRRATHPRCFVLCGCMLSMTSNCGSTLISAGSLSLPFIPGHTAIVPKKKKSPVLQNKLAITIMLQTFQVLWGHQLERNLLWTHSTRVKLCLWWTRKQHMVSWHSPPTFHSDETETCLGEEHGGICSSSYLS